MVLSDNINGGNQATTEPNYDRQSELKAFDDTKAGVKGLVDAGITRVPRIFIHPPQNLEDITKKSEFRFPVIDLDGVDNDCLKRKEIVDRILDASETWGFFQVVNHGIDVSTLEEMVDGVRRFHEDTDTKKQYHSRDFTKKMIYNSNFDLFSSPAASWRDSFNCIMAPDPPQPEELPSSCRPPDRHRLCTNTCTVRTLLPTMSGARTHLRHCEHSDYSFLTVLLQDNLGGLQVLYQDQWVDVPPLQGALVLISNDKLKSVEHRVLVSRPGPRISVAGFFGRDTSGVNSRLYGPIKELLSEKNPPKYRPTTINGYTTYIRARGVDGRTSALQSLKLQA
ncbi:UNVERIFIED_CONTAM: 1-aminocyclopropane-1-carboxylate oxidase1 [Sesamum latifolium]|uniref:1-aminocyclopropane-1-carboxylate oxidase1 n=1 Tax=Sesamum latifolium TaxID=2727402 RepID=A0AAW2XS82_9LAMI